jgi:raffinose/stachyose/melibiose transport system permease protein
MTAEASAQKAGSSRPAARRFLRSGGQREVPWLFLAPAAVAYLLAMVAPTIATAVLSFTDFSGVGVPLHWVGLEHYRETFQDEQAAGSLRNTLILTAVSVVVQNALGLALALALHKPFRGRTFLRVVFFAPVVLSPVVIGYLWQYIYSPDGGINRVLQAAGLDGLTQVWLGDPKLALWAIAVVLVWQSVGFTMIIYAAGLEGVPDELLEAAEIDGAGPWRRFRDVTLPLLAPALTINLALSLINGLRTFDQVLAMTGGGPGYATETVSTVIYKQFANGEYAYSTALAVELTIAIVALSAIQVLILRRREVTA